MHSLSVNAIFATMALLVACNDQPDMLTPPDLGLDAALGTGSGMDSGTRASTVWRAAYDVDGDGYGSDEAFADVVADELPHGFVTRGGDCDDADPSTFPNAPELDCLDPVDHNCDGRTPSCVQTCTDGVRAGAEADVDCGGPCPACGPGLACATNADCASLACNLSTQSCDLPSPSDAACVDANHNGTLEPWEMRFYYRDVDGDGFGDSARFVQTCSRPSGYAAEAWDCDDHDPTAFPGAPELDCLDPVDHNCDGYVASCERTCADGLQGGTETGVDCGGPCEACTGGEPCAAPTDCTVGYCEASTLTCVEPDMSDPTCAALDRDHNGALSRYELLHVYLDADGDGHGEVGGDAFACAVPDGYALVADDYDDADASRYPGAVELSCLAGADADCNGRAASCAQTCADGLLGPGETDIDCGGPCATCAFGASCATHADCESGFCDGADRCDQPPPPSLDPPAPGCVNVLAGLEPMAFSGDGDVWTAVDADFATAWSAPHPYGSRIDVDLGTPRTLAMIAAVIARPTRSGVLLWAVAEPVPGVRIDVGSIDAPTSRMGTAKRVIEPPITTSTLSFAVRRANDLIVELAAWECAPQSPSVVKLLPSPPVASVSRGRETVGSAVQDYFNGVAVPGPEVCVDGLDNDLDGLVDCEDVDCARVAPCTVEHCSNHIDDDDDGLLDCQDDDCFGPDCVGATLASMTRGRLEGVSVSRSGGHGVTNDDQFTLDASGTVAVFDGYGGMVENCHWWIDDDVQVGGGAAWYASPSGWHGSYARADVQGVFVDETCSLDNAAFLPRFFNVSPHPGGHFGQPIRWEVPSATLLAPWFTPRRRNAIYPTSTFPTERWESGAVGAEPYLQIARPPVGGTP